MNFLPCVLLKMDLAQLSGELHFLLLYCLKDVLLQELIVRVTSNKVDSARCKDHKECCLDFILVEDFNQLVAESGRHKLVQLWVSLMGGKILLLQVLCDPVPELSDSIDFIEIGCGLIYCIAHVCEDFRNSKYMMVNDV